MPTTCTKSDRQLGAEMMRTVERLVMLRVIDSLWIEHLTAMEQMRQGIGLRAMGHSDPLIVIKKRGMLSSKPCWMPSSMM